MSTSVCTVDVVGLVNWESEGREMVDRDMVYRSLVSRDGVGGVLVDGGGVSRLLVMVMGTRVLWGGGAGLVRPRIVWEPGRVGQVLQVRLSK